MLSPTTLRVALLSMAFGLSVLIQPVTQAATYDNDTLKKALLTLHKRYESTIRENTQLKDQVDRLNQQSSLHAQRQQNSSPPASKAPSPHIAAEMKRLQQQLNMVMSQKAHAEKLAKETRQWQSEAKSLRQQLEQLQSALAASEKTQRTLEGQLRDAQNTRKMLPNNSPKASQSDREIQALKERLVALKNENSLMRDKLSQGAGLSNPAMQQRLELATTELKKAAETIGNQQKQISSLSERIEALQSLQMGGAITLTGQAVDPKADADGLQALLQDKQEKLSALKDKMATTPDIAQGRPAGGAVPLLSPEERDISALIQSASQLRKEGEWTAAEAALKKALTRAPNEASIHYNLGNIHTDTNRLEAAKRAYARAIALNPGFSQAHFNLGVLYQREGKPQKAKQFLSTFLQLSPGGQHADAVRELLKTL